MTVKSQGHVEIYIDASNAVRHCIYTRCRIYDLDITGPALCSQLFPNASLNRAIQSVSLHSFTLPPSTYLPPHLLSAHQNLIKLSPPILSPLFNNVAISTLNGLSTSGYASNWCIASSVDVSVYAGDQDVFKRSRQISPDLKSTFGWQIGVLKVILGGARG